MELSENGVDAKGTISIGTFCDNPLRLGLLALPAITQGLVENGIPSSWMLIIRQYNHLHWHQSTRAFEYFTPWGPVQMG